MKPRLFPSSACGLVGIPLLLALFSPVAQAKSIRLRNETIITDFQTNVAGVAKSQGLAAEARANGLFLVQLEDLVTPGWRGQLRALGIEVLKYVPDDAFVTRFNSVSTNALRALKFVRWVGPYRPDYKVHPRLAAAMRTAPQTNQVLDVNVLFSPQSTTAEMAEARTLFSTSL